MQMIAKSVQRLAKGGPGEGEIFLTRPDRPQGPPSILYNAHRVCFPRIKRPGRGVNRPSPSSAEVEEKSEGVSQLRFWAFMACSREKFNF
jgi:hypothetical protein